MIKFTDDYAVEDVIFQRNSRWDYYDKREELVYSNNDPSSSWFMWVYRIKENDKFYTIPGDRIVEYEETYNKDYTKEEWNKKIHKDAMVKDGNYVKAWKKSYGIANPVKSRSDQNDYNWKWRDLSRRMERLNREKSQKTGSPGIP